MLPMQQSNEQRTLELELGLALGGALGLVLTQPKKRSGILKHLPLYIHKKNTPT